MTVRRRKVKRKLQEKHQPRLQLNMQTQLPNPEPADKGLHHPPPAVEKQAVENGYIPVAIALEILAKEFEAGGQEESLCRAAVGLAEESGVIANYRAKWDMSQDEPAEHLPIFLFDRRQSLELIGYHQSKGNKEALKREKERLKIIEGRLLLGQSSPLKITSEDLNKLEDFIKESGF